MSDRYIPCVRVKHCQLPVSRNLGHSRRYRTSCDSTSGGSGGKASRQSREK